LKTKQQGSLYLLDYDQIAIKWREPYGYVCRGLILDSANDFAVVAFGLHKFFNIGEGFAADLDRELQIQALPPFARQEQACPAPVRAIRRRAALAVVPPGYGGRMRVFLRLLRAVPLSLLPK
jgi:hypothetical protein